MTKVGLELLGQLKMEFFHEQIICLECKINIFFFSFLGQNLKFWPKISFAGSPNGHDNDYDIVD